MQREAEAKGVLEGSFDHRSERSTEGSDVASAPATPVACSPAAEASPRPTRLEKIGGYQILAPIAQGGMAQVYLARPPGATGAHRQVAVKRLRPELAGDERFVAMFSDELQIASRITHPNVCTVLDYGVADGEAFLAMEYLAGETLASVRRKLAQVPTNHLGTLTVKQRIAFVCRVIADASEGLHAAHEQRDLEGRPLNIVHRDVSPENLLVTFGGCVKVLDFGVARASCQTHTTRVGDVKGKFAYMAPEVLDGQEATRCTDVWGLGVILWELLTLKRLFRQQGDAQTLQAVSHMTIEPPSKHEPAIPAALDAIVMAALRRDPAARTCTARALGQALDAFLVRRRLLSGPAEIASVMKRLFPTAPEEKRRQLLAALTGKPVFVERVRDSASHSEAPTSSGNHGFRSRATAAMRSFRKPWRLALLSALTGAAFWWIFADVRWGVRAVSAESACASRDRGVQARASALLEEEIRMASLLKAAGTRVAISQVSEDTLTVTITLGPAAAQISPGAGRSAGSSRLE